jgi:aminoglycoside phosphotransferase (APT) family kinase protein
MAGKARAYGMQTDASQRFERGVDFELQATAIERATRLLLEVAGGKPGPVVTVVSPSHLPVLQPIRLRASRLDMLLGIRVPHDDVAAAQMPEAERETLSTDVAEVLARLHKLDPEAVGLGDLGRKENYIARQLKRWASQWEQTKTDPVPVMEDALRRLSERMPAQVGASIVHGDYRLGNFIVAGGRIQAVLDWELCTLGDPLADLGYLLNTWMAPEERRGDAEDSMPTTAGGFSTREALMARYAALTGFDLEHIDYYRAFQQWRLAAIRQGVYKRYLMGAMGSARDIDLESYRAVIVRKAEIAVALLGG